MRERSGKYGERGRREGVGEGEKWEIWGERKEGSVGEGEKWEDGERGRRERGR